MIRKNPRGDLPQIHETAYVDQTAILCGKVIVEENVFIGPYAVIRADEVDDAGDLEPIRIGAHSNIQDGVVIHSKSTERIGPRTDLAAMPRVTAQATEFSEDVVRTNHELVQGYKRLQNEF
jgi:carbonic anhydrase/acetyltransferase-like protein (isoleucine patch superfamily)